MHPEKKDIPCCGAENCELTACNGYVSVQAPDGLVDCCGYEDCHNKECNNFVQTVSVSGKVYACCGSRDCYVKSCDNYTTGLLTEVCCGYEQCIEDQCTYTKRFGSSQEPFEIRLFLHPEDMNKRIYLSFGAEECATFLVNSEKATEYHYNWPGCGLGYNRPDYILYDLSDPSVRKYFREGVNWIRGSVFNPDGDKNMEFKGCANFDTFIRMKMNTWSTDSGSIKEFTGSSYVPYR